MAFQIIYKPAFLRTLKKFPMELREEVKEKIRIFREDPKHPSLRVHKLKGALRGRWSFSVNYQYRVVFRYENEHTVLFLMVGDHDVYK
ncbi:type II toxin-antitoxin system mRNA interferase toxin, RelE/StbE family [Candidatus Peregrinibacteria bacterium]|nr:type II toxin-antitoxin system mRNA interferase toxin, RelE/StbE family [Candidatus Peregrinibacteria bacterium]